MSFKSKILLFFQFLCFGYLVFFQDLLASGIFILVQFLGFLLCLWSIVIMGVGNFNAQPEVKRGARLVKIGPYALIRNPMYTGLILFFGAGLASHFNWPGVVALLVLLLIFILKVLDEERFLAERFGKAYLEYKDSTFRMIPYLF